MTSRPHDRPTLRRILPTGAGDRNATKSAPVGLRTRQIEDLNTTNPPETQKKQVTRNLADITSRTGQKTESLTGSIVTGSGEVKDEKEVKKREKDKREYAGSASSI